jgi:alpha-glucosidase
VVIARRSGSDWYVGAMTNEAARTLQVPLDFLGAGQFIARTYADGATPGALTVTERSVGRDDTIQLRLAPSGGGVIEIRRVG